MVVRRGGRVVGSCEGGRGGGGVVVGKGEGTRRLECDRSPTVPRMSLPTEPTGNVRVGRLVRPGPRVLAMQRDLPAYRTDW